MSRVSGFLRPFISSEILSQRSAARNQGKCGSSGSLVEKESYFPLHSKSFQGLQCKASNDTSDFTLTVTFRPKSVGPKLVEMPRSLSFPARKDFRVRKASDIAEEERAALTTVYRGEDPVAE